MNKALTFGLVVLFAFVLLPSPVHAQTTVVACTWFQLQCWLYPFMFFMFYTVVFIMFGALGGASSRGLTILLLAGLDNAAIAATAMGMLTAVVPILSLVLTVLYMVRIR